ncbi:MAG TPA: EAL domain-containing protein [Thermoanaerobaculia bacterium]|nr:EAL domain-containing protein [Thermoanaerobaculia bacterium]
MSDTSSVRKRSTPHLETLLREPESGLRRQNAVLVDLARRPSLHSGNLAEALRDLAMAAAETLDVERVGVWFFTPDRQSIRCSELFERTPMLHSSGAELTAARYPVYFKALETERTITADDARLDPRTSGFTESYLDPFGVTSMLDAPIRRLGQITGVLCFEHTGAARTWTAEEENFASSMADLVAMAIDATERRSAQEALRRRVELEQLIASISTRFANLADEELDSAIEQILGEIGRFIGADRTHLMLLSDDDLSIRMTHEWDAPGAEQRKDYYGDMPAASFPWWIGRLQQRLDVIVNHRDDMPAEAVNERRIAERQGLLSVIFVPMILKKRTIGSVGATMLTRHTRWSDETIALLRITGEIFVSALERSRAYRALRSSEQRHRLLFERNLAGVYRNTVDGRMLDCNDALPRMLGYESKEEFLALNARDLYFDPQERDNFVGIAQTHGSIRSVEICLRRKDGQPVWLLESAHLTGGEGEPQIIEGTVIDITDRKLAETALRESEARYRLMAENSTDLISRSTMRGQILYVSEAVRSLLGYDASQMVGHSIFEFIAEEDHHGVREVTERIETQRAPQTFSYRAVRSDGTRIWFETTSRAIADPITGELTEIVAVSRDISERRRAEEQIEYQAYHDALTGLPNRLLFRDRLTIALAHAKRQQTPVAVMFLDLDRFKFVNDTLGHSLGDELLRIVGVRLRTVLREGDTIARMGGDEFTVLLTDLTTPTDAAKIAQKLLDTVAHPVRIEGHELYVTTSIGIALYPSDGDTAEALLKNADGAMYRAKEVGRNSYQLCTPAMNSRAAERLSIENSLRRALDRHELLVYYQPIVRLDTRQVVGMEALLRWDRPGHGIVPPAKFIGIAEETRMILSIGEWVLREACRKAKTWDRLRVAVNLSPRQFQQTDLCNVVASALEESGLEPRLLELEITESTAMLNTERSIATLKELRELGVRIALDDFGTGHSSLSYLRRFPLDRVKIDREFVQEIENSRSNRAIVSGVVAMAHGLDLAVTAEGVETEAQVQFLRENRCEEVQGFLFGKPSGSAGVPAG